MSQHAGGAVAGPVAAVPSPAAPPARHSAEPAVHPVPPLPADARPDPFRGAVEFAAAEAARQAEAGATAQAGAHELLRWASRRRVVLEQALAVLGANEQLSPAVRDAAVAIVERALRVGLLF
jgi:hypothetical protein